MRAACAGCWPIPERPSDAAQWAVDATAELEARGQDCDVDVAAFIASHFRERLLFFSMNHPANELLAFIAQGVCDLIGVGGSVDLAQFPGESARVDLLSAARQPRARPAVRFATQVVAGSTPFRIRGVTQPPLEAIGAFFRNGSTNSTRRPVELNLDAVAG